MYHFNSESKLENFHLNINSAIISVIIHIVIRKIFVCESLIPIPNARFITSMLFYTEIKGNSDDFIANLTEFSAMNTILYFLHKFLREY